MCGVVSVANGRVETTEGDFSKARRIKSVAIVYQYRLGHEHIFCYVCIVDDLGKAREPSIDSVCYSPCEDAAVLPCEVARASFFCVSRAARAVSNPSESELVAIRVVDILCAISKPSCSRSCCLSSWSSNISISKCLSCLLRLSIGVEFTWR